MIFSLSSKMSICVHFNEFSTAFFKNGKVDPNQRKQRLSWRFDGRNCKQEIWVMEESRPGGEWLFSIRVSHSWSSCRTFCSGLMTLQTQQQHSLWLKSHKQNFISKTETCSSQDETRKGNQEKTEMGLLFILTQRGHIEKSERRTGPVQSIPPSNTDWYQDKRRSAFKPRSFCSFIDPQLHINRMLRHKHITFEQKYNQYLQLLY